MRLAETRYKIVPETRARTAIAEIQHQCREPLSRQGAACTGLVLILPAATTSQALDRTECDFSGAAVISQQSVVVRTITVPCTALASAKT